MQTVLKGLFASSVMTVAVFAQADSLTVTGLDRHASNAVSGPSYIEIDTDVGSSPCYTYLLGLRINIASAFTAFGKTYSPLTSSGVGPQWYKTFSSSLPPHYCNGLPPISNEPFGWPYSGMRLVYQWGSSVWGLGCDGIDLNGGADAYFGTVSSGSTIAARWDCARLTMVVNVLFGPISIRLNVREQTSSITYNELVYDLIP